MLRQFIQHVCLVLYFPNFTATDVPHNLCHLPGMIRVVFEIEVGELVGFVNVQLGQGTHDLLVRDELSRHCADVRLDELLRGDAPYLQWTIENTFSD